ncbi:MAG TPA: leucyl/phenylalanyl-tRNA--protein transferase [Candidatus Saccharimonadales bacterium]|nr:leucyl/phenylalanyl-tRNA--protein transferase [Candidatus Saccharimonadales bacterium]
MSDNLIEARGVVARGGDLSVENLIKYYQQGVFPYPLDAKEDSEILWCQPAFRGVLTLGTMHVSRSLQRFIHKKPFDVTFNMAFEQVICGCAEAPREDPWMSPAIIAGYTNLHRAGYAYSVECWQNGELAGGLYGTYIDGIATLESMFYIKSNASKVALVYNVQMLLANDITWMDTQVVTPITESFGSRYIPDKKFQTLFTAARKNYRQNGSRQLDFNLPPRGENRES